METEKTGLETIYTERYATCFELYLRCGGGNLSWVEREMRALGYADFNRRILYNRKERGTEKPGWIEKFGWRDHLKSVPPPPAGQPFTFIDVPTRPVRGRRAPDSPPSKGGVPEGRGGQPVDRPERPAAATGAPPAWAVNHPVRGCESPAAIHPSIRRRGAALSFPSLSKEECSPLRADGAVTPAAEPGSPNANTASFESWLKQVSPDLTWDWPYQKYIYEHLQRVTDGTCKRLMIFMPPRHGKSELVTIRYAGWRLWNDPKMKIIVSSYNQKLADRFSRGIRKLLSEEEDKQAAGSREVRGFPSPKGINSIARDKAEGSDPGSRCHVHALPEGEPLAADVAPLQGAQGPPAIPGVTLDPLANPGLLNTSLSGTERAHGNAADARIRLSCDHPQCAGMAADHASQPGNSTAARIFPRTSRSINTASQWETAIGGGVKAVGVGAGVTGFGGQLIVIDDPVKSRAEAESPTYRERLWDWYRNDLYTRLEPDAAVILIQTRWHQDDLAGRLLQEMNTGGDAWEVIDLPALAEAATKDKGERVKDKVETGSSLIPSSFSSDPLGRSLGAALCPDRFDETKLADIRRQLGGYAFSALYQQHPTPAEGGIFKRAWFTRFVDRAPDGLKWKRGYDLAVSTRTNSCFTASFRVAFDAAGNLYIADGFRERLEYPDQKRFVLGRVTSEPETDHGIEKALHGQALIQDLRRETQILGKNLRGIDVTADKVTRALTWAPLAEEGKVVLVKGDWNRAFLDELADFPAGQHDDQIDAVSLAFSMLSKKGGKAWAF